MKAICKTAAVYKLSAKFRTFQKERPTVWKKPERARGYFLCGEWNEYFRFWKLHRDLRCQCIWTGKTTSFMRESKLCVIWILIMSQVSDFFFQFLCFAVSRFRWQTNWQCNLRHTIHSPTSTTFAVYAMTKLESAGTFSN